jgi:magnesium-transporting ATPase (P-type)
MTINSNCKICYKFSSCLNKETANMNPFNDFTFISNLDKTDRNDKSDRKFMDETNNMNSKIRRKSRVDLNDINSFLSMFKTSEKFIICVSGKGFIELINRFDSGKQDKKLKDPNIEAILNLVERHGTIFYRMSPSHKMELIKFLKRNSNNIVGMCGDGANDCGALLCADIGIALTNSKLNKITAHYYCYKNTITSVDIIIKFGRACFENSILMFKYMILYSFIQITSNLILYYYNEDFTDNQYLFMDGVTVLTGCLLLAK